MTSVPTDKSWSFSVLAVDVVKLAGLKATACQVADKEREKKPQKKEKKRKTKLIPNWFRSKMFFRRCIRLDLVYFDMSCCS